MQLIKISNLGVWNLVVAGFGDRAFLRLRYLCLAG